MLFKISLNAKDVMAPLETETKNWSGLKTRIISAVILAAIVLAALFAGGGIFSMLVMIAALIMIREWDSLTANENKQWKISGMFYVALPCAALIWLRGLEHGFALVMFVMLTVWSTDIGAYFAGRFAGGAKLAPRISPNKTWAGLLGGMASAGIVGGISTSFTPYPAYLSYGIFTGMAFAVISQMGDLFESWLKRRASVKDSGALIPGHGGLLDRVDGLIPVLPVFACMVWLALRMVS